MSKLIHSKIFVCIALLIAFIFLMNTISFARTVSFSLHDGLISTLVGNDEQEDDDDDSNNGENNPGDDNANNDEENNNENNEEVVDEKRVVEDGTYIISSAANDNYVLDINNSSLDWGGNLQLWTRLGGANQKFYIAYQGDGYYKISSVCSALAIDVENGSKENSTNIRQWEDNGADAQRFKIIKNSDGSYSFIAKCSGKALDINGGIYKDGTNIQQWDHIDSKAQHFKLEKTDLVNEGIVSIKKATDYKVSLDVPNNSSKDGLALELYETNNTMAQRFEIHKIGTNEIRIRTVSSGGWLTEKGKSNGSAVVQSGNSKTAVKDSNTWIVEWNNGITLKNKESGLYLDMDWGSTENGTKIQVWEKNNDQSSQRYIINGEKLIQDGWYEIDSALGTRLDLDNSGSDWGTNIHMWEANNQNNQKFKITYTDSGYLITTMYGLALDVENGSKDNGANIRQWENNGATCQRWWPEVMDEGYIKLRNANSGKYLDVANASKDLGANVQQYEGNDSDAQLWKLNTTTFVTGWFSMNGAMYCADPTTGQIIKNCTRVDPTMTDPSQYGAIYDFDSEGRATWHIPTFDDLPGGHGKSAPVPTNLQGDQRQRTLLLALSRVGCDYKLFSAPTGFVCDGLTAWSITNATGIRFRNGTAVDDQDMSWQYIYIKNKNGIKTDISQAKPGDIIFWGDPANIENHSTYGSRHVSIYYHDGLMIHAADVSHGVCIGDFSTDQNAFHDFIGVGSPYDDTSKCEIPH